MPRQSRIDAPGALHHLIARGIDRQDIFRDDRDRDNFLDRLRTIFVETDTVCFAWALLSNHFHLLLRSGDTPVASVMRRVLTGYAGWHNRRHGRYGHLFQNRYKSILCEEGSYLLELVRYIHLNPLRAGMIGDLATLESYPYCGHFVLMGRGERQWQDTATVLLLFSDRLKEARCRYRKFVEDGVAMGRRDDLTGGGLVRSCGGWDAVRELRKGKAYMKGDERILGNSEFVDRVLRQAEERYSRQYDLKAQGIGIEEVAERVAEVLEVPVDEVWAGGRQRQRVTARRLLCFWAVRELGMSQIGLAERLGISQAAVSMAVRRGEGIVRQQGYRLVDGS